MVNNSRPVVEVARRGTRLWQYSLRDLLLAIFFVALSFGCFRLASVQDIQIAIIPGVISLGLALGLLTNHYVAAIVGIALLALVSYSGERCHWDGGFPLGEIRLAVCDSAGIPIVGARCDVYDGTAPRIPRGPPLLMEDDQLPMLTDGKGEMICHSLGRGFGGTGHYLFWYIPIGFHSPEYKFHVSHANYGTVEMPLFAVLDPSNETSSTVAIVAYGDSVTAPVYRVTVRMPPKK